MTDPARTVLVVDDFPAVLAWASRAFTRAGWTVLTATDGREALERWRAARAAGCAVSVLITDVDFPEWGGASLAARLREEDAELPVLALFTGERSAVTWPTSQIDRTAFFQKPMRAAVLLETAAALLTEREHARDADDDPCPLEPSGVGR